MTSPAPQNVQELDESISMPTSEVVEALHQCPGPVTVLGAGGKMGYHVCRMLQRALAELGREEDLIAVSRFGSPDAELKFTSAGMRTLRADLSDPEDVARVPTAPNVFFLAGVKFGTANDVDLLRRMNETMPQLVANRFSDSRIVVMSTGCVYSFASPDSGGSTEDDATDPPGAYAQSCLARERAFALASETHGTRCVFVRLNYSIDLRYGVLLDLAKQIQQGTPVNVDTGFVNVIWQGDAVQQILRCLPLTRKPPLILNITGRETHSVRELATRIGERFGKTPDFAGRESERCWISNSDRARKLFGEPSVEMDQMIDWIADWISSGCETLEKPTHFQNRDGNY
ncbi:MAG: NAD-dependent epimerase/dehydratase family protein [Rubripirellula sp.]